MLALRSASVVERSPQIPPHLPKKNLILKEDPLFMR